jgi:hypothetical protein
LRAVELQRAALQVEPSRFRSRVVELYRVHTRGRAVEKGMMPEVVSELPREASLLRSTPCTILRGHAGTAVEGTPERVEIVREQRYF